MSVREGEGEITVYFQTNFLSRLRNVVKRVL